MVVESQYSKAVSLAGMTVVLGGIIFIMGFIPAASGHQMNAFLIGLGFITLIAGIILFNFISKFGYKFLSTKAYIPGTSIEIEEDGSLK